MSDASQLAKLKMDAKTTLKASDIRIHDFAFSTRAKPALADDILDQIAQTARSPVKPATGITLNAVDIDFGGLRVDLGDEGPDAAILREVKRLIAEDKFAEAIGKVEQVFAVVPGHPEAIYLKSYCHFKLKALKAALAALRMLKGVTLKNRLRTRVQSLLADIRQLTVPHATKVYAAAVKARIAGNAAEQLKQYVDADPEYGQFHYFLAGVLVVDKKLPEAYRVVVNGLRTCDEDREQLETLLRQIAARLLPEMLGPARAHFRGGKYPDALRALQALPPEITAMTLATTFIAFLENLTGATNARGGLFAKFKTSSVVSAIPPIGKVADQRELYEFLVSTEMAAARKAIDAQDFSGAEATLLTVVRVTPAFTVANHLLATCIYNRVAAAVKLKMGQDLDEASARQLTGGRDSLNDAFRFASIASEDEEIPDAPRLASSIEELRNDITQVVTNYENQTHDAKIVNQLIDEFFQVLIGIVVINQTTDAHQIRNLVKDLWANLQRLRSNLPDMRRRCKGEQARSIIDIVSTNFVEPNYNILRRVMG